jgi:ubiquinone/menaquinone biosynthesis C-methylase UbiE
MKRSTLGLLCCPSCKTELILRDESGNTSGNEGELFCSHCERSYIIKNGIVHFIDLQELEDLNQRLARFYNRFSRFETIIDWLSFLPMGGERKARTEILPRLELNNGRVLEVSIGSGGNLPYLIESPKAGDIYGLDISVAQLTNCHRLATNRGWSVELFLGKAEELPFKSDSFDNVFHIGGINFFSEKKKAIGEMIRVARPGSKIVIADESEQVARVVARFLRLSRETQDSKVDTSVPIHLVPETMKEIRVDGIWKMHGRYHGYCLEFRKPG